MILYSTWLVLAAVAVVFTGAGAARLLVDSAKVDNSHVLIFLVGAPLNFLVALSSASLDFICTGGSACVNGVQSYSGEWWFLWVFVTFGMLNVVLVFVASFKLIKINQTLQLPE